MKTYVLRALLLVVLVYLGFAGVLFYAMGQRPERFSRFMMNLPRPLMMISPFPPLWNKARAGTLKYGDMAPDFELSAADHSSRTRLSRFRGSRPVVLIFGSYT